MKKMFKEILCSKLFILVTIISVILITFHFIKYENTTAKYEQWYMIETKKDTADYDEMIEKIKIKIESLDTNDKYYEDNLKYLNDELMIYQSLKQNNIAYESVYDFGKGYSDDKNLFVLSTNVIMLSILVINALLIMYIIFLREFDNYSYSFIYTNNKNKIILQKILSSFIAASIIFVFYLILIFTISNVFENEFSYVLIIDRNNAYFEKIGIYILKNYILQIYYNMMFILLVCWMIAFIVKSSLRFLISTGVLFTFYVLLQYLSVKINVYLGLHIDYSLFNLGYENLMKLVILFPILFCWINYRNFFKSDL